VGIAVNLDFLATRDDEDEQATLRNDDDGGP
jgi:hypothetical protein